MSSKNKLPKLKRKTVETAIKCPCCGEVLNISIVPNSTDFLIEQEQDEMKIQNALKKNGIEFG